MTKRHAKASTALTQAAPDRLMVASDCIEPLQYFRMRDRHPRGEGPWKGEPDKIGWVDQQTGRHCIILREPDGTLSGYAGVTPDHALFGFSADAVPSAMGISVHGGLNYGRHCEANVPEMISVCHVLSADDRRRSNATRGRGGTSDMFEHVDLWWFGFSTDHPGDLIPSASAANRSDGIEVYRDLAYVYAEVVKLASQLSAIEDVGETPGDLKIVLPVKRLTHSNEGSEGNEC
tara:strand:- start:6772 stop:7470 length:699 start_codon:yes stop_codon:yes gene_type:complete